MSDPRLYILMRTDIPTMGWGRSCGKAVAQGTHAANQCVAEAMAFCAERVPLDPAAVRLEELLREWEDQTGDGFGTTLVLGVDETTMRERVARAREAGLHAGITHDPTYPHMMLETSSDHYGMVVMAFLAAVGFLAVGAPWVALLAAMAGTGCWIADLAAAAGRSARLRNLPPLVPLDTCAYVFGEAKDCRPVLGDLRLML